jgi:hypothetical protein
MYNLFTPEIYTEAYDTKIYYKPETIQILLKVMKIVKLIFKPTKTLTKKHVSISRNAHLIVGNVIKDINGRIDVTPEITIMAFLLNDFKYKINARDHHGLEFKAILDKDFLNNYRRNMYHFNEFYDPEYDPNIGFKIQAIKYFEDVFGLKFKPTPETRSYMQMNALPL